MTLGGNMFSALDLDWPIVLDDEWLICKRGWPDFLWSWLVAFYVLMTKVTLWLVRFRVLVDLAWLRRWVVKDLVLTASTRRWIASRRSQRMQKRFHRFQWLLWMQSHICHHQQAFQVEISGVRRCHWGPLPPLRCVTGWSLLCICNWWYSQYLLF